MTNIQTITFTGADDSVDPYKLVQLSKEFESSFDFTVEWGILYDPDYQGSSRYPSKEWVERLYDASSDGADVTHSAFSLHLCGKPVKQFLKSGIFDGEHDFLMTSFKRVQFNLHDRSYSVDVEKCLEGFDFYAHVYEISEFIIQIDSNKGFWTFNKLLNAQESDAYTIAPLHDASSGCGVLPNKWSAPLDVFHQGYAGGLGPSNLREQLQKLHELTFAYDIWVDMETKLFTGDQFDLDKCRQCAQILHEFTESKK